MYNEGSPWNQSSWSQRYYHQYMQQHNQMTQWLQQVHQSLPNSHHHCVHSCQHHCCGNMQNFAQNCQPHCCSGQQQSGCASHALPAQMGHAYAPASGGHACAPANGGHACAPAHNYPAVNHTGTGHTQEYRASGGHGYGAENTMEHDDLGRVKDPMDSDDDEEEEDSEEELVFNVDAILAMRATREVSDHDSEDSFELLDSVADDMQDYVKLDAYGNLERIPGKLADVNTLEDEKNKKGLLKRLYGEKATTIGGMEALMTVQFDHLCDTLEPTLWPVLPILL